MRLPMSKPSPSHRATQKRAGVSSRVGPAAVALLLVTQRRLVPVTRHDSDCRRSDRGSACCPRDADARLWSTRCAHRPRAIRAQLSGGTTGGSAGPGKGLPRQVWRSAFLGSLKMSTADMSAVYRLLASGATCEQIAAHLSKLENECMGLTSVGFPR